jgi:hypothetical protein
MTGKHGFNPSTLGPFVEFPVVSLIFGETSTVFL